MRLKARTYVRAAARHFGIKADPFEAMLKEDYEELKDAFNKEAVLVNKVNLPFSREAAAFVLNALWESTRANDELLHSALMIRFAYAQSSRSTEKGKRTLPII